MSNLSGVDQDGSMALLHFAQIAKEQSPAAFAAAFNTPALILGPYITQRSPDDAPARSSRQSKTFKASSPEVLRYVDKVVFVAKRAGNPFPDSVFIGRTLTNDIPLDVQSVSKLHGRFEEHAGTWYFTDTDSSLGTWINGRRLEPGSRHALASSDILRIGPDLVALFLFSRDLYEHALGLS